MSFADNYGTYAMSQTPVYGVRFSDDTLQTSASIACVQLLNTAGAYTGPVTIYDSQTALTNIGLTAAADEGYLVMPNMGFQLFTAAAYASGASVICFNDTTVPKLYSTYATATLLYASGTGIKILSGGGNYQQNTTLSIILYKGGILPANRVAYTGLAGTLP